jgi:peptide deformylase
VEGDLVHAGAGLPNRFTLRTKDERFDRLPASPYLAAMPIRPLVILPDPRLRLKSEPVDKITDEVRRLAADMLETMYDAPGVGLAAIQIGVPKRIVVMDTSKKDEERRPTVLVNPEITWSSEEKSTYEEGCLSIPEFYEEVERPARVKFRYTDLDGKTIELDAEGLAATCIQHEIDHLDGVLFIDHLSRLKRERVTKKFAKAAKREQADADS